MDSICVLMWPPEFDGAAVVAGERVCWSQMRCVMCIKESVRVAGESLWVEARREWHGRWDDKVQAKKRPTKHAAQD